MYSDFGQLLSGEPKLTAPTNVRRRRGATAMEYLAALSLIFIVILSAVNYFGNETKKSLSNSGDIIQKASEGNKNSPPP